MKWKLFLYFFGVFAAFSVLVVVYQQSSERTYREEALQTQLDIYSGIAAINPSSCALPPALRVTVVTMSGGVVFDNTLDTIVENHIMRPEIQQAKRKGVGSDIRTSSTTSQKYYYYARIDGNNFIRVALPFNEVHYSALTASNGFLWMVVTLFIISMIILWVVARNFGDSVEHLKNNIITEQNRRTQLKTEMTSSIAHELRTPVSAIRAYTETLLSTELPRDKERHFIERTAAASMRLTELLSDVSILTKIEEASHLLTKEEVDFTKVVADVIIENRDLLAEHSINVITELPAQLKMMANKTLIYAIVKNIIENAIHYAGNWINLKVELVSEDDKSCQFAISDTGRGIDSQSHLDRIFERFYRVEQGRVRSENNIGSGLGLSIVRHAVEFHGGTIKAVNNEPTGLKFIFTINKF